ncbi:MAG: GNAT family N-acetyltransferase [Clostridia bacterium]|nr:GNAT family N-acetyltransferase [Clostridia bacterium]
MEIKAFDYLPCDAKDIRIEVFVEEQGFTQEFDEHDRTAVHLVGYIDGKSTATARIIGLENGYLIGRIAVRKPYRKNGLGGRIIAAAEDIIRRKGGKTVYIHAQQRAVAFYEKQGYFPTGEVDEEEGCVHWMMKKDL